MFPRGVDMPGAGIGGHKSEPGPPCRGRVGRSNVPQEEGKWDQHQEERRGGLAGEQKLSYN